MTGTYATGTISLIAYYPFAISNREVEAVQDNAKLTFTNDGTADGYPSFKFNSGQKLVKCSVSDTQRRNSAIGTVATQRP